MLQRVDQATSQTGGAVARFHCDLKKAELAYFLEHRVANAALLPGAAMFEMTYAAASALVGKKSI